MKYIRFKQKDSVYYGIVNGEQITVLDGSPITTDAKPTGEKVDVNEVRILAPLIPNEIIGIGANFIADESERPETLPNTPIFFNKPKSSVIGPNEQIILPPGVESVKFEAEIAVVIGKRAENINSENVQDYIFGITVGNDVTSPDYFRDDGHWFVGKSFPSFTPLGPVIETDVDIQQLSIHSTVNGKPFQDSPTSRMIVSIPQMIAYLSNVMILEPGDVILTGSPVGADFIQAGDTVSCSVSGVGTLTNPVTGSNSKIQVSLN